MNFLKNKPIGKKLLITFAMILTLFAITTAVAVVSLLVLRNSYTYMAEQVMANSNRVNEMRRDIQASAKYIMYSATTEDVDDTATYIEEAKKCLTSLREGIEFLRENSTVDSSIIDNFEQNMNDSVEYEDQMFELLEKEKNKEAQELYFAKYYPVLVKANEYLLQIKDYTVERADATYAQVKTQIVITFAILFIVVAVTFVGTVLLGLSLTKNLKEPIRLIYTDQ